MNKRIFLVFIVALFSLLTIGVLAHSGRTDSSGGHWNRSTGEYHYHGTNTDYSDFFLILGGCLFLLLIIFLVALNIWCAIDDKKQKKIDEQRKIEEQRRFEEEKKKYSEMYADKDILSLCGCPEGTYIGKDGLPTTNSYGEYGKYTVYVPFSLPNNYKYHLNQYCCGSVLFPSNIVKHSEIMPCLRCAKNHSIDMSWYSEYIRIKQIKKYYDIP